MKKLILALALLASMEQRVSADFIDIEPFASINLMPLKVMGWCRDKIQVHLQTIVADMNPEVIVELGSWMGQSAFVMAAASDPDVTRIYCVDTWLGDADIEKDRVARKYIPTVYQQFLSNVVHYGLEDTVFPMRMTTNEAAEMLDLEPNLVFVDAQHTADAAYEDVMRWWDKLAPGGMICGDDFDCPGVAEGVQRAAAELGVSVHFDEYWWELDRKAE